MPRRSRSTANSPTTAVPAVSCSSPTTRCAIRRRRSPASIASSTGSPTTTSSRRPRRCDSPSSAPDAKGNRAPLPLPLTSRTFEGTAVKIDVPLDGIDPDGDSVTLVGITTPPSLGRIVDIGSTHISYEAYPASAGTDSFTYEVADTSGKSATGTIRIGVIPRPTEALPPNAVDDVVELRPGRTRGDRRARERLRPERLPDQGAEEAARGRRGPHREREEQPGARRGARRRGRQLGALRDHERSRRRRRRVHPGARRERREDRAARPRTTRSSSRSRSSTSRR